MLASGLVNVSLSSTSCPDVDSVGFFFLLHALFGTRSSRKNVKAPGLRNPAQENSETKKQRPHDIELQATPEIDTAKVLSQCCTWQRPTQRESAVARVHSKRQLALNEHVR